MWYLLVDDISVRRIFIWEGILGPDWGNPLNWDRIELPGQFDIVLIPSSPTGAYFPTIGTGQNAACWELIVEPGAYIGIDGILNIHGPNP
jgi:hypothetical protein